VQPLRAALCNLLPVLCLLCSAIGASWAAVHNTPLTCAAVRPLPSSIDPQVKDQCCTGALACVCAGTLCQYGQVSPE